MDTPLERPEQAVNAWVGAAIRKHRGAAGLSMRELARRAGTSQPFLSQIERGAAAPSLVNAYRLAAALGVTPADLVPPLPPADAVVVRAGEGRAVPVSDRPDAAVGRLLVAGSGSPLECVEYRVRADQWISEWFDSAGQVVVHVISGRLEVQFEGEGSLELAAGDTLSHPGHRRHRWSIPGSDDLHAVLVRYESPPS